MNWLDQSTAVTIHMGPCLDKDDGLTPETGLTAGGVDEIGVYKHEATALTDISGTTTLTHRARGTYTMTLSTGDTGTLGHLRAILADDSIALPVWRDFMVVPATWTTWLKRLSLSAGQIIPGTVDAASFTPTKTQFEADDITEATADHYRFRVVYWTSGVLAGQVTDITAYALSGSRGRFTVTEMTDVPEDDANFIIV